MDYDISLLMSSHIKSMREAGEFLYRLDSKEGLNRKELEKLIELLLCINEDCDDYISKSVEEELSLRA